MNADVLRTVRVVTAAWLKKQDGNPSPKEVAHFIRTVRYELDDINLMDISGPKKGKTITFADDELR